MFRSLTAHTHSNCRLALIGRLKSHGVWVCVTGDAQLVLFHLIRAQEQMLYARMMISHVLPVEHFQQPVKLDVRYILDCIIMTVYSEITPCLAEIWNLLISRELVMFSFEHPI